MTGMMERILPTVQKPARYVGGEYNQIVKNKNEVRVRVAFCFPDTYEIGMSNVGMRILYGLMNELPQVWCERVFTPWGDMEAAMKEHSIPLWALESHDPVADFDMLAFTIGYEMSYSDVLHMLRLAGVPLHAEDRKGLKNMVFAGGTCAYNPEPLADFVDFFSLGEGEEITIEILNLYDRAKQEDWTKERFLLEAAQIPGVYVPSLYTHRLDASGRLAEIIPAEGAPTVVTKRVVEDFDHAYYPVKQIVPSTEIVHDRTNLELFRGCIRGCRFCQAGFCYRPIRNRSAETLIQQAKDCLNDSGNHEITLASLSSSDYKYLEPMTTGLLDYCEPRKINLSLPSLRADNFSRELMERVQKVRKSGLTFAPEAGTQRLRDVINKNLEESEILDTCRTAFSGGWSNVKLYFMLGLPTETDEDVLAIADLAHRIVGIWREVAPNKKHGLSINLSTSYFVPKPFTPFQWVEQISPEEYMRRVRLLQGAIRSRVIDYRYHDPNLSRLEAVLARGGRNIGAAIERAVELGVKLDAWDEYFRYDLWTQAFAECGIDIDEECRAREKDEVFPWDTISVGVRRAFLWHEYEQAREAVTTPDCRQGCAGCGARALCGGKCDE